HGAYPLTRQNSRWCLVSERWWFGVGWWVGVVVVGEALLEFFPCGGEGVDEPGGDEVAFVEGVSGWALADCPGGSAGFELGVGGGGGVGDGFFDGVEVSRVMLSGRPVMRA